MSPVAAEDRAALGAERAIAAFSALRVASLSFSPYLPMIIGMPNFSAKISQSRTTSA
jgi:hypothetical protein